jgi:hypothetical protein
MTKEELIDINNAIVMKSNKSVKVFTMVAGEDIKAPCLLVTNKENGKAMVLRVSGRGRPRKNETRCFSGIVIGTALTDAKKDELIYIDARGRW